MVAILWMICSRLEWSNQNSEIVTARWINFNVPWRLPFFAFLSMVFRVLFTKIVRNNTMMTTMTTPLLVAMALSAAWNNNQQRKGANKRGDGVKAMEMATVMVTATATATAMANSNGKSNCNGDGDGNG
jgi:hypothetical protein